MKTKYMAVSAILSAFICVCAPWAVPFGAVPLTLATLAVYITAGVAGPKQGTLCVFLYILIGAAGIPVFSGFSGGVGILTGVTGGFIIGYLPCAFITGFIIDRARNRKFICPAAMAAGTLVCYAFGLLWYLFVTGADVRTALTACILPFLPCDVIKIAAASAVLPSLKKMLSPYFDGKYID